MKDDDERRAAADAEYASGIAHREASSDGDRLANLEQAVVCFQTALSLYSLNISPLEWARLSSNWEYFIVASCQRVVISSI